MKDLSSIQQRSVALVVNVNAAKYFLNLFATALEEHAMTVDGVMLGMYNDEQLIMMWNEFWLLLPDDASCRRAPFFDLCDLCEEMYNGDEPDETD